MAANTPYRQVNTTESLREDNLRPPKFNSKREGALHPSEADVLMHSTRQDPNNMSNPFTNFFRSKILAVATIILVFCGVLAAFTSLIPFWFSLRMDLTFIDDDKPVDQQVVVKRDINCGIFFLDENRFINIIMLQKADNTKIMPVFLHVAQIFYLLGSIGVILCAGVGVILSFRTHASPPGEICLAASTTFLVLAQIIAVVCVLIQVNMYPRAEWQNLPVEDYLPNRYTYYTVLSARPLVILNWGFWIACVGTAFGLLAAIALWFHAMCSCCHLQKVRYEMLRQKPDEGSSPLIGQKAYQNMGYLRNSPQEYPAAIPPATGFRPAPQDYPPRRYEPQPSPPSDRMEFSEIGRELDL